MLMENIKFSWKALFIYICLELLNGHLAEGFDEDKKYKLGIMRE